MKLVKSLIAAALVLSLLVGLCGCEKNESSTSHELDQNYEDSLEIESQLEEKIGNDIPYDYIFVHKVDDGFEVSATINIASEITYMATHVQTLIHACESIERSSEIRKVSLNQCTEDEEIQLIFYTVENGFGALMDMRSGRVKTQIIENMDALMDLFPASKIENLKQENLTEEEKFIYDSVMDALNDQPERPEEEIFGEMAPYFGMTGSELREFMMNAMEKIYG